MSLSTTSSRGYPRPYAQYVLLERLGIGGMSEVDLARKVVDDGSFVRFLVVKRIKASHAEDPSFVRMFKDEARITSELHHANIGALYDFGKVDDEYYLALEFVPGLDARKLINTLRERSQRVPVRIALKIVAEVLDALDHAHHKTDTFGRPMGIVHRDVNPRNVMVSVRGEVKLIDFGVAKATDRLEVTGTDQVKGKFMYMAPEQLTGAEIDHRCDIYAAGLLLNELLSGVAPFAGLNQVQVAHRLMSGDHPELAPVSELPDDAGLRRAHDRALAANPDDRYPHARDFAAALRQVAAPLGGLPTNDQLAAFLGAVDPDLAPTLHRKMALFAQTEPPTIRIDRAALGPELDAAMAEASLSAPVPLVPVERDVTETVTRTGLLAGSFLVVSAVAALAALVVGAAVVVVFGLALGWSPSSRPSPVPPAAHPVPVPVPQVTPVAPAPPPAPEPEPEVPHPTTGRQDRSAPPPTPEPRVVPQVVPEPVPEVVPEPVPEVVPEPVPEIVPEPIPAPRVEVVEIGFLNVTSTERGQPVLVDGTAVGETALVRYKIPVGSHTIQVPGYTCEPRQIVVRRSQVLNVTCR